MRIISNFRDYYDSVSGYGIDTDNVWCRNDHNLTGEYFNQNRKNRRTTPYSEKNRLLMTALDEKSSRTRYKWAYQFSSDHINIIYVAFCGKVYPALVSHNTKHNSLTITNRHWNVESFILDSLFDYDFLISYTAEQFIRDATKNDIADKFKINLTQLEKFFEPIVTDKFLDTYIREQYPATVITDRCTYTRPKLSNVQFQRLFDPFKAYQEIEMYLNGPLSQNSENPPQVDDKHLAAAKGFDKWSFRKLPTKHKQK